MGDTSVSLRSETGPLQENNRIMAEKAKMAQKASNAGIIAGLAIGIIIGAAFGVYDLAHHNYHAAAIVLTVTGVYSFALGYMIGRSGQDFKDYVHHLVRNVKEKLGIGTQQKEAAGGAAPSSAQEPIELREQTMRETTERSKKLQSLPPQLTMHLGVIVQGGRILPASMYNPFWNSGSDERVIRGYPTMQPNPSAPLLPSDEA